MSRSVRRPEALVLAGLFLSGLAAVAAPAGAEPCPADSGRVLRVDVTLDQEARTIVVDPESVTVYLDPGPGRPNRVCWVVAGLAEGQTVAFESKEGSEELFPSLERSVQYPRDFANSGKPSHVGTWVYDVVVTGEEDEELMRLDPEVEVEEGP